MRQVTAAMEIERDGDVIRLDLTGTCPSMNGGARIASIELNGADFWGELTEDEQRRGEHLLSVAEIERAAA